MKVTKEQFVHFINTYPNKLDIDVYRVYEPPLITYNDFTLGNWPKSVVASTFVYDDNPNDYYYCSEEERIYIIKVKNVDFSKVRE